MDGARALTSVTTATIASESRSPLPAHEPWDTITTGLMLGCGLVVFGFVAGVFAGLRWRRLIDAEEQRLTRPRPMFQTRNHTSLGGTDRIGSRMPPGVNRFGELE